MDGRYSVFLQSGEPRSVGTLWLNNIRGRIASTFLYDLEWARDPAAFSLSPDLPLDTSTRSCDGLFLCFQDCSPDRWGRGLLRRQENRQAREERRKPRTLLDSDFLLLVSDVARQGAIRLSADEGRTFLSSGDRNHIPPLTTLPKLLNASVGVEIREDTEDDIRLLVAPGSSLGGARPKASVIDGDELLIAKFPSSNDDRDVPLWEYVTFKVAERAGLSIPQVRLQRVGDKSVLLVQRFDRTPSGRIPFMSAMSLMQAKDGDHKSYVDIAIELQATGCAADDDLRQLWSRMVFNMCVYNVDDHLRNHGFLRRAGGWTLSPAYDLEIAHPSEKAAFLHTAIIDDEASFDLQAAIDVAEFFRLKTDAAKECVKRIRKAVSFWRDEAVKVGAKSAEINMMRDSYEFIDQVTP